MSTTTLNKLPLNSCGKIFAINCTGPINRRLLDLGLIPNTPIQSIFKSPFGDPTAYKIRGSTIALREEDAKLIVISK